jgi:hypothetical protein
MANTPTTHYGWNRPDIGDAGWGLTCNDNLESIDEDMNILAGRVTTAETNISSLTTAVALRALKAGDTFTGTVKAPRVTVTRQAIGTAGAAVDLQTDLYTYFTFTTGQAVTITLSNEATAGDAMGIIVEITMGGAHTVTWPAAVKWPSGLAPVLGSSGKHLIGLVTHDAGTTWLANFALGFA